MLFRKHSFEKKFTKLVSFFGVRVKMDFSLNNENHVLYSSEVRGMKKSID